MNWRVIRPIVAAAIAAILILGVPSRRLAAQAPDYIRGPIIEDPPGPFTGESYVGPPPTGSTQAAALSTFIVTYNGFTPQAQAAFQAAVNIWASQIQSSVPIRVTANWTTLGANVLGSAEPTYLFRNFTNAPYADTFFVAATAKKISGTDLTAALSPNSDITVSFNSDFDWYLGTDGNAGAKYDLVTIVLHELAHGLGFLGSMTVSGGSGSWGLAGSPLVYDRSAVSKSADALLNTAVFPNPSVELGAQLLSNDIYFLAAGAAGANGGFGVSLYAPATWVPGSSYSHLDALRTREPNSLMTAVLGPGKVIHDPGPIVRGMFKDIGWGQVSRRIVPGDFDGDGKADITVFRPSDATWWVLQSSTSYATHGVYEWGGYSSDVPVRGDFDGDGKADIAVYRPSDGSLYILESSSGYHTWRGYIFGQSGDVPVPGDYHGNGRTDVALYRPSTGTWYIGGNGVSIVWGGGADDQPIAADFDGDGIDDLTIYRPSNGGWYVLRSSTGYTTYDTYIFGAPGDVPVPGDYDGDRRSEVAVYRPSNGGWYALQSTTNYTTYATYIFGAPGDIPVPADFDGDAMTDVAVYRPSNGGWYVLRSTTGYSTYASYLWGNSTDIPLLRRP